ncbi:hypothetical protein [Actinopolymorpha rutila]|uniref:Glycoside hydrolase family 5 domain-containing protein n=1 Tax=Actinopolymorpha rutila TaxID=446787 RepID=A0A852ZP10_9ACTN|nr:hypothetical protein [Actinopolymorpha rutila]NYH90236.1 hypothetical protein [Actinopolymorpha rutila]
MSYTSQSPATFPNPADIRLGIVRGISYGLFGPPDEFVPQARGLGAGLVRVYVYWGQVERTPGEDDWSVVDAFLDQLDGTEEVWVTVCSSSSWATRQPTDFLPPSPAHDLAAYADFVRRLVTHCAGRVHYWQCDNEPSNTGLLWAGTAPEYVRQLKAMYAAVKEVDPMATVVLGGCGYDVLASEPGSPPREFFGHLARDGRDHFDVFDVHLYDQPARIPDHLATARSLMRAHGYEKPVVVGEYRGPTPFWFPEAMAVITETMMSAFAGATEAAADLSTAELRAQAGRETPERRAMRALYARPDLPPELAMFLADCPPDLEARRRRMGCRDLVMRNLLALSAGVWRTICWDLAPEVPGRVDHLTMAHLMYATFPLLEYEGTKLSVRHPEAETFALLARLLTGARTITRRPVPGRPEVAAFEVDRGQAHPLLVVWDEQPDLFAGEDLPARSVEVPWPGLDKGATVEAVGTVKAVDAFGAAVAVAARPDEVVVPVSVTPVFVSRGAEVS